MSYETEVAALTLAVNTVSSLVTTLDTTTQSAYNVAVATAQTHAVTATNQVALATTQKTLAASSASAAASSASQATTQAGISTAQAQAATAAAVGASNIVLGVSTLYPAIRPSLDLDFANGQTVDPRITFTRESTATRTNSRGLIELVPSGVPRIDFDAVTGACKGLLIEEQRTNLLFPSTLDATWSPGAGVVLTYNDTTAPDGTVTATRVSSPSDQGPFKNVVVSSGTTYCQSIFIKNIDAVQLVLRDDTGSGRHIVVNPVTGTITGVSGTLAGYGALPASNGFTRYWFSYVADSTQARCIARNNFSGTTVLFWEWGAQIEVGAFPTTYIPTVASQVTRAADVASMTGANFSSWYRQDEGSFVAIASAAFDSSSNIFPHYLTVSDGTLSNRIGVGQRTNDDTILGTIVVSGVSQADFSATSSAVYGGANNAALAYKVNDAAIARSSVLSQTDSSLTLPTVNQMSVGSSSGVNVLNGHIRSLSYYNRRLTNAELQALSTQ